MVALKALNAANTVAQGKIVIERLDEKNKIFAKDLGGLRNNEQQLLEKIKALQSQVNQLELEKQRMAAKLLVRHDASTTPMGSTTGLLNVSGFTHKLNETVHFTQRSKSFANDVIHKLKRRVSFRSNSRPSFHIRSNQNLSIYRVSEASNESPELVSSSKKPHHDNKNRMGLLSDSSRVFNRGRFSASFYHHANRLSAWQ